jgi:hypothetical protein
VVEVQWKKSASDKNWRGEDFEVNTPGFVLLLEQPQGAPDRVQPTRKPMESAYVSQLTGNAMREVIESIVGEETAGPCISWLKNCAVSGKIPFQYASDQTQRSLSHELAGVEKDPRAEWGPKVKIGVPGREGECYLMEYDSKWNSNAKFWELPSDILEKRQADSDALLLTAQELIGLPDLRYKGQHKRPTRPLAATNPSSMTRALNEVGQSSSSRSHAQAGNANGNSDVSGSITGSDDDDEVASWGADVAGCQVGSYAVIYTEFESSWGIEVIHITNIVSSEKGSESFQGVELTLDSNSIGYNDAKCLTKKWYKQRNARVSQYLRPCWAVFAYFKKLTKGGKLPTQTQNIVIQKTEEQQLKTFTQKTSEHQTTVDYRSRRKSQGEGEGEAEEQAEEGDEDKDDEEVADGAWGQELEEQEEEEEAAVVSNRRRNRKRKRQISASSSD